MTDLILIAALLAMVALARLYVRGCEAIAPDDEALDRSVTEPREPRAGAPLPALMPLPLAAAGAGDWVGLVLAVALLGYLLFSLLAPERFR